ncbi:MAG: hypothetical protein FWD97_01075 [Defluviitaleaceae bacterium]|nr:hypothetical protein [Defluviitaleaceae bacterium]
MTELKISDDFTIEDIHKIREYNYERRKGMTFEERKTDIEKGAKLGLERIEQLRKEKALTPMAQ